MLNLKKKNVKGMKFDCTKKIGVLSCTKPKNVLKLIHHTLLCDKKTHFHI